MDTPTESHLPPDPQDQLDEDPTPPAGTSPGRFAPSLAALTIGAVAVVMSWQLGVGSLSSPGAGFWPILISSALVVLAMVSLALDRSEPDLGRPPLAQILVGVGSLALFIAGFTHMGLLLPTFAVLVVWLRFLAHESRRATLIIATTATAGIWLVFDLVLGVPFPPAFTL